MRGHLCFALNALFLPCISQATSARWRMSKSLVRDCTDSQSVWAQMKNAIQVFGRIDIHAAKPNQKYAKTANISCLSVCARAMKMHSVGRWTRFNSIYSIYRFWKPHTLGPTHRWSSLLAVHAKFVIKIKRFLIRCTSRTQIADARKKVRHIHVDRRSIEFEFLCPEKFTVFTPNNQLMNERQCCALPLSLQSLVRCSLSAVCHSSRRGLTMQNAKCWADN